MEPKSAQQQPISIKQWAAQTHPYGLGIILGVGRGTFAIDLLQTWSTSPGLYLCDPYIHIWKGYDEPENLSDKDHQLLFEDLRNRLQPYQNRYSIVRDFSNSFAITYKQTPGSPPTSLVYVDTIPQYDTIKRDLEDWWPTIGMGGVLSGPNYDRDAVRKAVHDFAREQGNKPVQLFTEPGTWFILKQ